MFEPGGFTGSNSERVLCKGGRSGGRERYREKERDTVRERKINEILIQSRVQGRISAPSRCLCFRRILDKSDKPALEPDFSLLLVLTLEICPLKSVLHSGRQGLKPFLGTLIIENVMIRRSVKGQ